MSSNFTLKWSKSVGIYSTMQPLMHDVDGDGIMEIFMIGTTDGIPTSPARLVCLKGNTGALVYQKTIDSGTGGGTHRPLVIADAFNDGRYQVFYSRNGYGTDMTCVWATNGTMLWHTSLAGSQYHIFSVFDTDQTGHPYVYVVKNGDANPPTEGKVYKLWATNGTIKTQSQGYVYHCSNGGVTIADANFDGDYEIYVTDRSGTQHDGYRAKGLHCFNDELQIQWNNSVPASSINAMLADVVPGNNQLEIVLGYQGSNGVENSGIRVIYANGTTVSGKSSYDLDLSIHDQPSLYDVDDDGGYEFFTAAGKHLKAWDLSKWSLDKDFGFDSSIPPIIANVLGDEKKEIVAPSNNGLRVYDGQYTFVDYITAPIATVIVQDIDNDGLNEIITHERSPPSYYIKAYDTPASASVPCSNTRTPFYGDLRLNVENTNSEENQPPEAGFVYTSTQLSVNFDASASIDPDGTLTAFEWTFGDGAEATGEFITHQYLAPGTYPVTLLVRDNDGAQDSLTRDITIEKSPTFLTAIVFGKLSGLSKQGNSISFTAERIGVIMAPSYSFKFYQTGEKFSLLKEYIGFIGPQYIFALCNVVQ